MRALHDAQRNEPIYLCGTHAVEIARSMGADIGGIKSQESAPAKPSPPNPAASSDRVPGAQPGKRYRYILLLIAGLALVGGLFGLRLFRAKPSRPTKPAVIAEARKKAASRTLPQKAARKAQAAVPPKQSQAVPNSNPQAPKQPIRTANVAVVGGTIARQVLPAIPKSASDTIRGTILVSVKVQADASGNVEHTELVVPGPSRYFARLSVESARGWKFNPPFAAGKGLPSEWTIHFYFTRQATKAAATEIVKGAGATTSQK